MKGFDSNNNAICITTLIHHQRSKSRKQHVCDVSSVFWATATAPLLCLAAPAHQSWRTRGCSRAAAAVSLLSGLHVRRPLRTLNPSLDSFVSGNSSRRWFSRCMPASCGGVTTVVANAVDENHGHVLSSGAPSTSKIAFSYPWPWKPSARWNKGLPLSISSAMAQLRDQTSTYV